MPISGGSVYHKLRKRSRIRGTREHSQMVMKVFSPVITMLSIIINIIMVNVKRMQSLKDHTLFIALRQCRTVPSFQNDN